jgi:hypothetical protein
MVTLKDVLAGSKNSIFRVGLRRKGAAVGRSAMHSFAGTVAVHWEERRRSACRGPRRLRCTMFSSSEVGNRQEGLWHNTILGQQICIGASMSLRTSGRGKV